MCLGIFNNDTLLLYVGMYYIGNIKYILAKLDV